METNLEDHANDQSLNQGESYASITQSQSKNSSTKLTTHLKRSAEDSGFFAEANVYESLLKRML